MYATEILYKTFFDCKGDTSLLSLFMASATPKETVAILATTNLIELAFVGEAYFAEGCNVNLVAGKFSGYEDRSSVWSS